MRVLAISSGVLAGCAPINEGIGLSGGYELSALTDGRGGPPPGDAPSLDGFNRRAWEPVAVMVPSDQVAHHRTYVKNLDRPRQPEAWAPAFPDATEALEARPDAVADVRHMARDPIHAAFLALWWPVDMGVLQHWPWNVQAGPADPYERAPFASSEPVSTWRWVGGQPPE